VKSRVIKFRPTGIKADECSIRLFEPAFAKRKRATDTIDP
jgi:hypothetical protein